jgi:hypothetical protein
MWTDLDIMLNQWTSRQSESAASTDSSCHTSSFPNIANSRSLLREVYLRVVVCLHARCGYELIRAIKEQD